MVIFNSPLSSTISPTPCCSQDVAEAGGRQEGLSKNYGLFGRRANVCTDIVHECQSEISATATPQAHLCFILFPLCLDTFIQSVTRLLLKKNK